VTIAVIFGLQWIAVSRQSLTGDGAHHLVAGYQSVRYGQNLINLEHPPLVKLIAAIPLLFEPEEIQPPIRVQQWRTTLNQLHTNRDLLRRATIRSRLMVLIIIVLPMFLVIWALGNRFSPNTGFVVAAAFGLSFTFVGNFTILQTDAACTLGFALVILAAIRFQKLPSWQAAVALGLASSFALNAKFTGVLLGPTVLMAILAANYSERRWSKIGIHLIIVGGLSITGIVFVYSVANWNYDKAAGREVIRDYCRNHSNSLLVGDHLKAYETMLLGIEDVQPGLAQWATGLFGLRAQNAQAIYPCYALGEVTSYGRWWYFPLLLAVKLPFAIWIVFLAAGVLAFKGVFHGEPIIKETNRWRIYLILLTVIVYLAATIPSNTNLGVRHMMPIVPLLYILTSIGVKESRRSLWAPWVLIAVLAVESLMLTPIWMSATNMWWLGDKNITKHWFGAGNLEFRQNFIELERQLSSRGIRHIGVLYLAIEAEIVQVYIPDAWMVTAEKSILPGWYVVNTITEQLVPAFEKAAPESLNGHSAYLAIAANNRPLWDAIRKGRDYGYIAGTFHLYRVCVEDG